MTREDFGGPLGLMSTTGGVGCGEQVHGRKSRDTISVKCASSLRLSSSGTEPLLCYPVSLIPHLGYNDQDESTFVVTEIACMFSDVVMGAL